MARRPSRAAKRVRSKGGKGGRRAAIRGKATAHYTPPTVNTKSASRPSGPFNRFGISPGGAMMRGFMSTPAPAIKAAPAVKGRVNRLPTRKQGVMRNLGRR
jgi:hypothetical protein